MAMTAPQGEPTEQSLLGDLAHEIGAAKIGHHFNKNEAPECDDLEMDKHTDLYLQDFLKYWAYPCNSMVEGRVAIPEVHSACFGTPDAWQYHQDTRKLIVWDFKYGMRLVEEFENRQGITYAVGLHTLLTQTMGLPAPNEIEIRIVQPRGFHKEGPIRSWTFSGARLAGYANELAQGAERALSADAKLHTGAHCRDCDARFQCPAAISAGVAMFEMTMGAEPADMTPESMAFLLTTVRRAADALAYLDTGLSAQIEARAKKGQGFPGWYVEGGSGAMKWTKTPEEIKALGAMMGVELLKAPEPMTPTQAVAAGIPKELIEQYSTRPKTAAKLKPVSILDARKAFS